MQLKKLMLFVMKSGIGKKGYFKVFYIGGKIGILNDYYDMWFVGLIDMYIMGVWVGKDILSSVEYFYSISFQFFIFKGML